MILYDNVNFCKTTEIFKFDKQYEEITDDYQLSKYKLKLSVQFVLIIVLLRMFPFCCDRENIPLIFHHNFVSNIKEWKIKKALSIYPFLANNGISQN